jgi:putative addiction module killer protein
VMARIERLSHRNLGDCKPVGGVFELRLHFGPGYRIYFGIVGGKIVLLLCGGDKKSQKKDIVRAKGYLDHYQRKVE